MASHIIKYEPERGAFCTDCPLYADCIPRRQSGSGKFDTRCISEEQRVGSAQEGLRHRDIVTRMWLMLMAIGALDAMAVGAILVMTGHGGNLWG